MEDILYDTDMGEAMRQTTHNHGRDQKVGKMLTRFGPDGNESYVTLELLGLGARYVAAIFQRQGAMSNTLERDERLPEVKIISG